MKRKFLKVLGFAAIAFVMACLVLVLFLYLLDKDSKEYIKQLEENSIEQQQTIDKSSSNSYIGKWQYDTGKGNIITFTFEKGGIGKYEQSTKEGIAWEFTYEIKEDVIILTRNAIGTSFIASYELNSDGTELNYVSGDMPQGTYKRIK